MISSEKDTKDIYSELDPLNTFNPENCEKLFSDLTLQHEQQPFNVPLPSENEDILNHQSATNETTHSTTFEDLIDSVMRTIQSRIQPIQCTRCKVKKTLADFGHRKNGERMKICLRCTAARRIGIITALYRMQRKYSTKS